MVVHERRVVKNSFITYVCYAPDVLFWTVLYIDTSFIYTLWYEFSNNFDAQSGFEFLELRGGWDGSQKISGGGWGGQTIKRGGSGATFPKAKV